MPMYEVKAKGADKPRLIDASSGPMALRHAAKDHFTVEVVQKPSRVAQLMNDGVKLEVAGDDTTAPASE
jgi:hypothetical protein